MKLDFSVTVEVKETLVFEHLIFNPRAKDSLEDIN